MTVKRKRIDKKNKAGISSFVAQLFLFGLILSCVKPDRKIETIQNDHPIWQYCVKMDDYISSETDDNPEVYMWIPENCRQVKGVVFAQNNMIEEGLLENKVFRAKMRKLDFAEVWVSPMFTQEFNFNSKDTALFQNAMQKLANISGYKELGKVPVMPIGHSSLATFPWNFAAWNPQRTLCVVSIHGDAPQTNLTGYGRANIDWANRNIDGVPGLFVLGEYEWSEERLMPGFIYQKKHMGSVLTWFADAGHGHFDYSQMLIKYVANYIEKAARYRLSKNPEEPLKKVMPLYGWLIDRWRYDNPPLAKAAPFSEFTGNRFSASWVFDEEMANETEAYYKKARAKKQQYIGLKQNGVVLTPNKMQNSFNLNFIPKEDGISFNIKAFFSDSTRINPITENAGTPLHIDKITGPVKKLNDTTFQICFNKVGFNNKKRNTDIWLIAHNDGDSQYKSVVQQIYVHFPPQNLEGKKQTINFPEIKNQNKEIKAIPLRAQSNEEVPLQYYVKYGPAYIKGDSLMLVPMPLKNQYPIEVSVVAWQYGIAGVLQSATPVKRTFLIK